MNSYRASKLNSERPGSSAREYEYENSNYGSTERRSKIPKLPKRTYSLEGKKSSCLAKKANTKTKTSTTSMIPRPEWKKQTRRVTSSKSHHSQENLLDSLIPPPTEIEQGSLNDASLESDPLMPSRSTLSLESKVNKDLMSFKNSVLRIPEYWTDAGETVTSILKNAINIITKQYPRADVESFEKDIESILKATDSVKQHILTRTENIINKANQIYAEKSEKNSFMGDEELRKITRKISELKNEVHYRKNVFGDLLKYGSEMKQLLELEKTLKQRGVHLENPETEKIENDGGQFKHFEGRRCKVGTETVILQSKKTDKHSLQSCGDTARQNTKIMLDADGKSESESKADKATQTVCSWYEELRIKEKELKELNKQVMELHQLCRDHISKFKNFNLQIKMRGICNKSQHSPVPKEVVDLQDEKMELLEKNCNLAAYNKDLESAIKQKDLDLHHKEKLLYQQKKLLHVRDELIGMLKNRCNLEEQRRYSVGYSKKATSSASTCPGLLISSTRDFLWTRTWNGPRDSPTGCSSSSSRKIPRRGGSRKLKGLIGTGDKHRRLEDPLTPQRGVTGKFEERPNVKTRGAKWSEEGNEKIKQ